MKTLLRKELKRQRYKIISQHGKIGVVRKRYEGTRKMVKEFI
jgi:hypothetical protein